jgi:hypothetical protein
MDESEPVYAELQVDAHGNLWAKAGDASGWWFVFDGIGHYVGRVRIPPGLDVKQIGPGVVLDVERDEFDVEHVKAYEFGPTGL